MARTLPTTVVQALFSSTTTQAYFVLVTIEHPDFTAVRVVNNTEMLTASDGRVFMPFPFSVIMPPDTEDLQYQSQLIVYDVEQSIVDNLRFVAGSRTRMSVTLEIVEADTPTVTLARVSGLEVQNVTYSEAQVTLDLTIDNFLTEGFPRDSFTPGNFPGIF